MIPPAPKGSKIKESGKPVAEAKGVKPKNWHNGRAELEIGSGNYPFTVAPLIRAAAARLRFGEPTISLCKIGDLTSPRQQISPA